MSEHSNSRDCLAGLEKAHKYVMTGLWLDPPDKDPGKPLGAESAEKMRASIYDHRKGLLIVTRDLGRVL